MVTAYLLTATASTPLWGKISDLYGRRLLLPTRLFRNSSFSIATLFGFMIGAAMFGAIL